MPDLSTKENGREQAKFFCGKFLTLLQKGFKFSHIWFWQHHKTNSCCGLPNVILHHDKSNKDMITLHHQKNLKLFTCWHLMHACNQLLTEASVMKHCIAQELSCLRLIPRIWVPSRTQSMTWTQLQWVWTVTTCPEGLIVLFIQMAQRCKKLVPIELMTAPNLRKSRMGCTKLFFSFTHRCCCCMESNCSLAVERIQLIQRSLDKPLLNFFHFFQSQITMLINQQLKQLKMHVSFDAAQDTSVHCMKSCRPFRCL